MRVFFILLIFALLAVVCKAQDVIVTKDSKSIKVLVIQVTKDRVRYKHYDNADSPTYYIPIGKVSYIHYENGAIDRFDDEEEEVEDVYYDTRTPSNRTSATRSTSQPRNDDGYYVARTTSRHTVNNRNWMKAGLKAGLNLNFANIRLSVGEYSAPYYTGTKYAAHFGVFCEYRRNDFALQHELLFFPMKGGKLHVESGYYVDQEGRPHMVKADATATFYSDIEIIFMCKYYVNDNFSIEIGPSLGIFTSGKASYDVVWDGSNYKGSIKSWEHQGVGDISSSNHHSGDFSLNIGASYQIPNCAFGISARYSIGIGKIAELSYYNSFDDFYMNASVKNSVFQLGTFCKF